jgi:16S rRNA (cytidine1402-2'-O)-methyltransferase
MTLEALSSFDQKQPNGTLFLVPTPIGNLQDMTFRAVEALKTVDLIAAEDTRNTQKLLNFFEIPTPQISFHEHNTQERIPLLLKKLLAGGKIAQVSDAGMPSISDPGHELVKACIAKKIPVVALPGANAGLTALIASGLAPQPFLFFGFLSRQKKERQRELKFLADQQVTMILYEAPHHLKQTLNDLTVALGSSRRIVMGRELTKKFEEYLRSNLAEALEWSQTQSVRGEFCLLIQGKKIEKKKPVLSPEQIEQQVTELLQKQNLKTNAAIKEVAKKNDLKKQVVYKIFHHLGG